MLFSSIVFFFLFLPIILTVYLLLFWLVQRFGPAKFGIRIVNGCLLLISLLLYGWSESSYVLVILASTTIDYVCGLLLGRRATNGDRSLGDKWILAVSICSNLGFLGFFKYTNFGLDAAAGILDQLGVDLRFAETGLQLMLPLGISFYTFQSMSYTIDVYRGRATATRSFIDFACYVTMFPQLVAGPIVRYTDVARSLVHRTISTELFASGVRRFIYGLGKKVLIADTLATVADPSFAADTPTCSTAWLGLACYTLQIYFDFSGYSDMAIGLGRMLGFRFQENFLHPYTAQSIRNFWRRWHISLSTWFRDYLYVPLGGNQRSPARVYFNLTIIFLLCGLWHGASWTFIAWGALHGIFLVFERAGLGALLDRLWRPLRHLYTMSVVMLGWVIFRCVSLDHAGSFLTTLLGGTAGSETQAPSVRLEVDIVLAMVAGVVLSTPIARSLARIRVRSSRQRPVQLAWSLASILFIAVILYACAMEMAAGTHQPFIYFRF